MVSLARENFNGYLKEKELAMMERKEIDMDSKIILAGAMTLFDELFVLDLESGIYTVYKMDSVMSQVATDSDFNEFNITYGERLIHPDDREKFFGAFFLENLRKRVAEGERRISVEVRRKSAEGFYHWCELTATKFDDNVAFSTKMVMSFRDIDELRAARQEERYATHRFTSAVNSIYDAIYEGELYSDILHIWKTPGKKIKGFVPEKSIKKQIDQVLEVSVHPDYQEEVGLAIGSNVVEREFKNGKEKLYYEAPCMGEDGKYRWFSFQVHLLEMSENEIHVMYYIKDIDDAKKREKRKHDELQQALAMARKANDAKMEFLSRMSHDIRTPINAIVGMTAVVDENRYDPGAVGECLKKIDVSAKFLLTLIDDILDMSKIEGGKVSIVNREMSFEKLISDLMILCQNLANDKQQEFKISIGENVRASYVGDSLRINQVFLNLISNAFKYTPDGGCICFSVDAEPVADGKQWLVVVVSDNGIGMSEDFIGRAFEPFEQEDVERGRASDSSGLGLTLTLSLVVMMGGTISIKSEKNKGSAFTVRFPLEVIEGEDKGLVEEMKERYLAAEGERGGIKHAFNHEKILLVEDDELNLEIEKALLEMQGLDVETAKNGEEAANMFEQSTPGTYRAILMDLRMPVMDGLDAARAIRSMFREDAASVPIIIMTADSFHDEQEEAKDAGVNDYLTKPVDANEIRRHLIRLLNR